MGDSPTFLELRERQTELCVQLIEVNDALAKILMDAVNREVALGGKPTESTVKLLEAMAEYHDLNLALTKFLAKK